MVNVFVEPIELTIDVKNGETIHDGLERAGIHIETPCGGNGICGSCRILAIEPYKISPTPNENITSQESSKGLRLACIAYPESDTTIRLETTYLYDKENSQKQDKGEKILSVGISEKSNCNFNLDNKSNCNSNLDNKLNWSFNLDDKFNPNLNSPTKVNLYGIDNQKALGLAVDIGTTTLVIAIVSLINMKTLASASSLNPQVVHGHDVLSRINYSSTPNGLVKMSKLIRDKLNELIEEVCESIGSKKDEIVDVVIGANTTMLQIAASIDPTPLGHLPFKADIAGATIFPINQFGLNVNKYASVYLPPVLHAFVGSDISAGLLRCPEFFDDDKSVLYLDMGTNGEICLNVKGRRFATSTAAGPAFEGMGISSGMRATNGAVERVEVRDNKIIFHVIGSNPTDITQIKGLCGSGVIDLIAALLTTKDLDQSGKLQLLTLPEHEEPHNLSLENKMATIVKIESQLAFCYGENIYLTQKDIRQIQLAKGAVRTGIDLILQRGGVTCEMVDKVYIAGGFGNFLNPHNIEKIALLPKNCANKVFFCGNACIDGSIMLLTNVNARLFLESALHDIEHLQLADSPEFMNCFVKNLNFK
ncbi:MAG: DUF4445 domain-containing protein [Desulfamplus sp.]|nr:DUF4445 domain-containing protein [Desulfamplus sp.]